MSGLTRTLRRAEARRTGRSFTPSFRPVTVRFEGHDNGGYDALHPTRGWKRFSARRLAARTRMNEIGLRALLRK